MIDEDRTMQLFGYTSNQLSSGSHKRIVVVCEECGRYDTVENRRVRELCRSCSMSGERSCWFGVTGKDHPAYGFTGDKSPSYKRVFSEDEKRRRARTRPDVSGDKNPNYGKYGEESGHWNGGKVVVVCHTCGNEIEVYPSYVHDKNFCNIECKNIYAATMENRIALSAMQQGIDVDDWKEFVPNGRGHVVRKHKCIKMNDYFIGSDAHHLSKSIIVYIPSWLHRHIQHNLKTGENMREINMLAIQYLAGWW